MRMMTRIIGAMAAAAAFPAVLVAAPAEAATCVSGTKYTATSIGSSTKFDATSQCDGVYAITSATYNDNVRGRYHKDGKWKVSSYGWTYVRNYSDGIDKIVGNTVTGRDIKAQGQNYSQYVGYLY